MTLWSPPSTRRSSGTSPSPRPNCWRAKALPIDPLAVAHLSLTPLVWDSYQQRVRYEAVTFPTDMRVQSAEESAKHTRTAPRWTRSTPAIPEKKQRVFSFQMTFSFDFVTIQLGHICVSVEMTCLWTSCTLFEQKCTTSDFYFASALLLLTVEFASSYLEWKCTFWNSRTLSFFFLFFFCSSGEEIESHPEQCASISCKS